MRKHVVHDSASLAAAFAAASGGDTIILQEGVYDSTVLQNRNFDMPVTLRPATPNTEIVLQGDLILKNVSGVAIRDLDITAPPTVTDARIFVQNSRDIALTGLTISGIKPGPGEGMDPYDPDARASDLLEGFGYRAGIRIERSADVTVADADISGVDTAVLIGKSEQITVRDSQMTDLREGVLFYDVHGIDILDNAFADFAPWLPYEDPAYDFDIQDHPDMIQYWVSKSGSTGISDVMISGNTFEMAPGSSTQTIFGHAPAGMATDFTITDNVIFNGHPHGITITGVTGGIIADNVLLPNSASVHPTWAPTITVTNSTDMAITGNAYLAWGSVYLEQMSLDKQLARGVLIDGNIRLGATEAQPLVFWQDWLAARDAPQGGEGDDFLRGDAADEILPGGAGDDRIEGRGGDDILIGGAGGDILSGGPGWDIAVYHGVRQDYTVTPGARTNEILLSGPEGNDTLTGMQAIRFTDGTLSLETGAFVTNIAPLAGDDVLRTAQNTPLVFSAAMLLVNDDDPEKGPLRLLEIDAPATGRITVDPVTGLFTYLPEIEATGPVSVGYLAADDHGATYTGTVTFETAPAPDPLLAVSGSRHAVADYLPQGRAGTAVSADGRSLTIEGNGWVYLDMPVTITEQTVLRFAFAAAIEGEIHAIGFGRGTAMPAPQATFQLLGTQDFGLADYRDLTVAGAASRSYEIALGAQLSGDYDRIYFITDADAAPAQSVFRDIEILPAAAVEITGNDGVIPGLAPEPFAPLIHLPGQQTVTAAGDGVRLWDNAWTAVQMPMDITETTVLSFTFETDMLAEIHGIGFANGTVLDARDVFQIAGSQIWGRQEARTAVEAEMPVRIEIEVGRYLSGDYDTLVFIGDDDAGIGATSVFSEIALQDMAVPLLWLEDAERQVTRFSGQDEGMAVASADGTQLTLTDNAWKAVDLPVTLNDDSVLRFDFAAGAEGEIHGIALASEGQIAHAAGWQLAGSQSWRPTVADTEYVIGSGWQSYEIGLDHLAGQSFDQLVFIMDDDAGLGAESSFADVMIL